MRQIQTSFIPGAECEIVFDPTYQYWIKGDLAKRLRLQARELGQPKAELVREAVTAYLKALDQAREFQQGENGGGVAGDEARA